MKINSTNANKIRNAIIALAVILPEVVFDFIKFVMSALKRYDSRILSATLWRTIPNTTKMIKVVHPTHLPYFAPTRSPLPNDPIKDRAARILKL